MKLTAVQLRALKLTQQFHGSGYSILAAIAASRRAYAVIFVLCIGAAAFYWWAGWPTVSTWFSGMLLGSLLRDLGWFRTNKRVWPVSERIINWEAVEKLLAEHESRAT